MKINIYSKPISVLSPVIESYKDMNGMIIKLIIGSK